MSGHSSSARPLASFSEYRLLITRLAFSPKGWVLRRCTVVELPLAFAEDTAASRGEDTSVVGVCLPIAVLILICLSRAWGHFSTRNYREFPRRVYGYIIVDAP